VCVCVVLWPIHTTAELTTVLSGWETVVFFITALRMSPKWPVGQVLCQVIRKILTTQYLLDFKTIFSQTQIHKHTAATRQELSRTRNCHSFIYVVRLYAPIIYQWYTRRCIVVSHDIPYSDQFHSNPHRDFNAISYQGLLITLAAFIAICKATISCPVFSPCIFGEGIPPPKKITYNPPQTASKLCALNLFFGRDSEYKYITETFF